MNDAVLPYQARHGIWLLTLTRQPWRDIRTRTSCIYLHCQSTYGVDVDCSVSGAPSLPHSVNFNHPWLQSLGIPTPPPRRCPRLSAGTCSHRKTRSFIFEPRSEAILHEVVWRLKALYQTWRHRANSTRLPPTLPRRARVVSTHCFAIRHDSHL